MTKTIINKEELKKIEVIARKMNNFGFGEIENLKKELIQRYLSLRMDDLLK